MNKVTFLKFKQMEIPFILNWISSKPFQDIITITDVRNQNPFHTKLSNANK